MKKLYETPTIVVMTDLQKADVLLASENNPLNSTDNITSWGWTIGGDGQ